MKKDASSKTIRVVVETPKGSTEKYAYDKKTGFFELKKILPSGMIFPFDFGFIPDTKGDDGDHLIFLSCPNFIAIRAS
jgi:inorganic pyrophosphatase